MGGEKLGYGVSMYVCMYDDDGGSEGKEGGNRQTSLTLMRVAEPSNSCSVPTNQDGRSNSENILVPKLRSRQNRSAYLFYILEIRIIITQLPQLDSTDSPSSHAYPVRRRAWLAA